MGDRMQSTTPFREGQNTHDHKKIAPKVKLTFDMAKKRNVGQPDPLARALTAPPRVFDDSRKFGKRAVQAGGRKYQPKPWGNMSKGGK